MAAESMLHGQWLTTEQLARMLGLDSSTLRHWRTTPPTQGPPFVKMSAGKTLYSAADVEQWLRTMRVDPERAA